MCCCFENTENLFIFNDRLFVVIRHLSNAVLWECIAVIASTGLQKWLWMFEKGKKQEERISLYILFSFLYNIQSAGLSKCPFCREMSWDTDAVREYSSPCKKEWEISTLGIIYMLEIRKYELICLTYFPGLLNRDCCFRDKCLDLKVWANLKLNGPRKKHWFPDFLPF